MDYLKAVSENLKYLMGEKELNCTELSRAVNIDRSAIARYLRGERLPSTPSLIALADFFGCSADFILGRDEIPAEFAAKPCPPFSEQLKILLKKHNVSKYRLQKDTGINERTISEWAAGRFIPDVGNVIVLADYFKTSTDVVLGRV